MNDDISCAGNGEDIKKVIFSSLLFSNGSTKKRQTHHTHQKMVLNGIIQSRNLNRAYPYHLSLISKFINAYNFLFFSIGLPLIKMTPNESKHIVGCFFDFR